MKVLAVDDEHHILRGLLAMIGASPAVSAVVGAADGDEALQALESFPADLLITDIHMPEMSGLELVGKVKERGLCRHFAIVTGYEEFAYARMAIKFGVVDYLLKPVDEKELCEVLEQTSAKLDRNGAAFGAHPAFAAVPADRANWSAATQKAAELIHDRYREDISLEQVSRHVGKNPNYLSGLFRKETGMTFLTYLQMYRVEAAKREMSNNKMYSLEKIAKESGFMNVRHFFKVFKKYAGETPGEFRSRTEAATGE